MGGSVQIPAAALASALLDCGDMPLIETSVRAIERATASRGYRNAVTARWFPEVTPEVQRTYDLLGGSQWVPMELVRLILGVPGHTKRLVALEQNGEPWALVPVRLVDSYWEPMLFSVVAGAQPFLCHRNRGLVFAKLGIALRAWESELRASECAGVRWSEDIPWRDVIVSEDPEPYWRSTELWKTIIQAKRRTQQFELVMDDLDSAKWTIEGWRDRFADGAGRGPTTLWRERVEVAEWGLTNGAMHCWALKDGERWVAGSTGFVQEGRLSLGTIYRDPAYGWHGAGNRILYETFMWARDSGLERATIGGHFAYKKRWAPITSIRSQILVAPWLAAAVLGASQRGGQLLHRASPLLRGGTSR